MLKEFKTKLESDADFRAKFADVKTEDELDAVAGGIWDDILNWVNQHVYH